MAEFGPEEGYRVLVDEEKCVAAVWGDGLLEEEKLLALGWARKWWLAAAFTLTLRRGTPPRADGASTPGLSSHPFPEENNEFGACCCERSLLLRERPR